MTEFGKRPLGRPNFGRRSYTVSFAVTTEKRVKVVVVKIRRIKVLDCFAMVFLEN